MSQPVKPTISIPEIKIIHDPQRQEATRGVKSHTLEIAGQRVMLWVGGPNAQHAAERIRNRLLLGRSTEAFGGVGFAVADQGDTQVHTASKPKKGRAQVEPSHEEVVVETVKTKSGKEKPRETRPGFVFTLDGGEPVYGKTEQEVRTAAAISAFLTRGKLNPKRMEEVRKSFHAQMKKDCKVHQLKEMIVVKDEDRMLWSVGWDKIKGDWRFKVFGKKE